MSSTRADHGISGSLAGLRLCMVMHVGNSGGSRAWQGLLGRRPDGGIDRPPVNGCPHAECHDRTHLSRALVSVW